MMCNYIIIDMNTENQPDQSNIHLRSFCLCVNSIKKWKNLQPSEAFFDHGYIESYPPIYLFITRKLQLKRTSTFLGTSRYLLWEFAVY